MPTDDSTPSIAFVWRPQEISSAVVQAVRTTGARAIFDLSSSDMDSAGRTLLQADAAGDAVDLKVSASALMQDNLEEFLEDTDINRVWVELHPTLLKGDLSRFVARIAELSQNYTVIPVVGSLDLITRIVNESPEINSLALKGNEASGLVSSETSFVLYGTVRDMVRGRDSAPNLYIWGGIASPEAAGAFLAAGAKGIVFESLHWLTDLADVDDQTREKLSKLRPDHTDVAGSNLDIPCRLFNKGNSKAVKELKEFAGSLCGAEITDEQRLFFAERIQNESVHALQSQFDRGKLVPLGVEATFAACFVRRFGSRTEEAIRSFIKAIDRVLADASAAEKAFVNSPTAEQMGTKYPFVQGAMSWITDVPEFARKVAEAGGLPTIALGMMDRETLDGKLGRLPEIMGDFPYAVNVITLTENPHREAQLAWIKGVKPRFAVIAAGEPSHGVDLMAAGIDVIYIAPNEELLRLAFEAGIRYVICEGNEAGGHVGQHSTLTMAQIVLDLKNREPQLFEARRVILAGGVSNRETAFMAAMLGADAVQMGTVYLTTHEIVETGALTEVYRQVVLESSPGATVVTGEGTGLRVRSIKTARMNAICSLERDFSAGTEDESSFRMKIEALSAGSLFVAARGLDKPGGAPLEKEECLEQGQFMSGACAGSLKATVAMQSLHGQLAAGALAEGLPFAGPLLERSASRPVGVEVSEVAARRPVQSSTTGPIELRRPTRERIAITGMSVVNALGNSPDEIWAGSLAMKSGIVPVPHSRWNHEIFYHPRPRMPEKTYCKVGAFQNIEVSRKEIGVPPQDFRTMTDATRISMWLAAQAIEESGILDSDIPRERISVLISQNSGEAAATLQDVIIRGSLSHIISAVKRVLQLTPDMEAAIAEEVTSGRIAIDDTTLLGRLNCSAGGFICNKYGFMGPSFSVSAACATALVALYSAYQMVRNGIIDAAIVGGGEEFLTPMHFLEFSALGALAGLSGVDRPAAEISRPFDAARDGMVLGEGGGMIVIERESVALKRGAKILAYVTSMGASNNNLGMVESSRITQEIAIGASFNDASYGPESVDLVECHATSTRQGDVEEVRALQSFFNSGRAPVLTSFKSQIGHTLGASGINSLIRGVMAIKAGVLPSTLNFEEPDPEMGLETSGLRVLTDPEEWKLSNGRPRRFQVNAFGFGGSNYVVQVEQAMEDHDAVLVETQKPRQLTQDKAERILAADGIHFFKTEISGKPYRVAVVAESEARAVERIQDIEPFTNGGGIAAKRQKTLARQGIHVGSADAPTSPLAFVFPGQGSHYAGMGHELYQTFPVVRDWMDRAAEVAEFDLLHLLFHDREEDLQKTRWQQPALFTLEYAMVQYLVSLGVVPTAMAGHSLGELTALCLAGVYSFEDGFRIVNMRAICMDKACSINVDPGVMMAVDAPLDLVEEMLGETQGVYITNINSPHQIVIGGDTEAVKVMGAELKQLGHRSTLLRVSMAFHSPIMRCIHDELEEFVAGIEFHSPRIPVISNTTMKPFPEDTNEIKRIVMAHLESPVNWMPNIRTLWNDYGVRLFVEVGPREILSNLIQDIVEEADCIQTCLPSAEGTMYRTAIAQLFAKGNLPSKSPLRFVSFPAAQKPGDAPSRIAVGSAAAPSTPALPTNLSQIVQREINSFVLESFGKFLKPSLLAAIQRDHDPQFTEQGLEKLLAGMFPGVDSGPAIAASVIPQALPTAQPAVPTPRPALSETIPAAAPTAATEDVTEAVIGIIMDATGYERDEIEPEMDLREDLSIRSSRLPVIIDSVEGHFKIKIELEEFMDVRTISDISQRIEAILARQEGKKAPATQAPAGEPQAAPVQIVEPAQEQQTLKRMVFDEAPLEPGDSQPVELDLMDSVAVLAAEGGTGLRQEVGGIFRRDYGITIIPMAFLDGSSEPEEPGFDLRTGDGTSMAVQKLEELESLAGIVFIVDDILEKRLDSMETVASLLEGFFCLLKAFLDSPAKKFVLMIHKSRSNDGMSGVLAQGLIGTFLSAALEFASVQFRTVQLDDKTDLRDAIRGSLDRSRKPIETIYRDGQPFTMEGRVQPCSFQDATGLQILPEDVVVFSGGGYGITPFLARSLAPFGCKMVFLGRTVIDQDINFRQLITQSGNSREIAEREVSSKEPNLSGQMRAAEISRIARGLDIVRNVEELRSIGVEASYFSCDVTDPEKTRDVVGEILRRYGKINGIVHAAGFLRDSFIKQMTPEDFAAVVAVKFLGAWNLFQAARNAGLKFFTCLSSAASIQGNPGQANYAAANRIMSALASHLHARNDSVRFKAMMLPPIQGAGMAEDPEIKALMKRMNASYVHVDELGGLFCRELFIAPPEDVWVMFMRSLPDLSQVRLNMIDPVPVTGKMRTAAVTFKNEDFPMIDSVSHIDLPSGELEATRTFSQKKDLWIADHKPFKFLKYPLVSAIMALETFMEACRILYPHFRVRGVRDAQFFDIIECPEDTTRPSEISCRRISSGAQGIQCEVTLATRELSPSGRLMDRLQSNFKAIVLLGSDHMIAADDVSGFPVRLEELDSRPMDHAEALEWYEGRTDMQDRYRVIQDLDGTSSGAIRGRMVYKQGTDFAAPLRSRYQYSPYLLEALMQVVNFYIAMRDPDEPRSMIPYRIGEMMFFRKCASGEEITLEARMKSRDEKGITWNARALDETGRVLMNAKDIMMRWFSK